MEAFAKLAWEGIARQHVEDWAYPAMDTDGHDGNSKDIILNDIDNQVWENLTHDRQTQLVHDMAQLHRVPGHRPPRVMLRSLRRRGAGPPVSAPRPRAAEASRAAPEADAGAAALPDRVIVEGPTDREGAEVAIAFAAADAQCAVVLVGLGALGLLLADPKVDAVDVVLPIAVQPAVVMAALGAGARLS